MIIVDHTSPITDLVFTQDDSRIITTSLEGTVYESKIGDTTRCGEYIYKDIAAMMVTVSKTKLIKDSTIVAYYTNKVDETSIAATYVTKKKRC